MREKSQKPESVIQRHEDDSPSCESRAAVQDTRSGAREERAAMKEDDDRSTLCITGRGPDVEREAVLTLFHGIAGEIATNPSPRLWRDRRHGVCRKDPLPRLDGLRRSESRGTRDRCRIADSEEAPATIRLDATHPPSVCRHHAVEQKLSLNSTSMSDVSNPEFQP